ncbi:ROK family protein [Paenibacillus mendelii]|uniref:ROK family protein n=1 Tax=Paenibacillus mendelii TaxID=206163 RepID=A0ABV6JHE5_9BACL|nr:ROK family protein [Paenibacillus mendelii]MCQ6558200.1 ROK family protein [Paenibacillus mendelii]
MSMLAGVDIGGTKCAVCLGRAADDGVELLGKRMFPTPAVPEEAIESIIRNLDELLAEYGDELPDAIGISCGGPLDSKTGYILSPPNLPGWDRIDVMSPLRNRYGVPVGLQNDANACALAEWKWGAGKGSTNMIFLTFGTGMGAGLVLNGRLYSGTNDMAGEVGHVRMEPTGPVGYGKAGSFEGFCSGGGIARLARDMAEDRLKAGGKPLFCSNAEELGGITTKSVAEAAAAGDELALEVFEIVGRKLGRGLAILVDILNPEIIVIGSIYGRQLALLEEITMSELRQEALPLAVGVCRVVPAALQENVGDLAALSVALNTLS